MPSVHYRICAGNHDHYCGFGHWSNNLLAILLKKVRHTCWPAWSFGLTLYRCRRCLLYVVSVRVVVGVIVVVAVPNLLLRISVLVDFYKVGLVNLYELELV